MAIQIHTKRDILRHTGRRVVTAAFLAVAMVTALLLLHFGTDLDARITVRHVVTFGTLAGFFISVTVCALLTYRSGLLMMELTHARRELARLSQTDQLTGLLNRRGFKDAAGAALEAAQHEGAAAAIFMCDVDHFKSINDRYGHEIGDKVLAVIAEQLRQFGQRHGAVVGRHGGEEFAVVLTGLSPAHASLYAEEIRSSCAESTVLDGKTLLPVTISVGFTVASGPFDLGALLRVADSALYAAKRRGRDCVVQARSAA